MGAEIAALPPLEHLSRVMKLLLRHSSRPFLA